MSGQTRSSVSLALLIRGGPRRVRAVCARMGADGEVASAPDRGREGPSGFSRSNWRPAPSPIGATPAKPGSPHVRFFPLGQSSPARWSIFPRPSASSEPDGSEAFGYERGVVFPIGVKAVDPAKPVTLALDANTPSARRSACPRGRRSRWPGQGARRPRAAEIEAARALVPVAKDAAALGVQITAQEGPKLAALPARCAGRAAQPFRRTARRMVAHRESGRERRKGATVSRWRCATSQRDGALPLSARATVAGGAGALETWRSLPQTPLRRRHDEGVD